MTTYNLVITDAEVQRYRLMAAVAADFEKLHWTQSGIEPGAHVADVGCGPGEVSAIIADRVGPDGHVWAIDSDEHSLEYAHNAAAGSGGRISVIAADAADTGLKAESVDVVVLRHVLVHNGGREQRIVDHAAEITRPGGHVYIAEFEGTAARIRPADDDLDDLADRYAALHRNRGNDFAIGLRLRELVTSAGLEVVDFVGVYRIVDAPPGVRTPSWAARQSIVDAGLATDVDVDRWERAFQRLDETYPRPTIFYPVFIAIGRKLAA